MRRTTLTTLALILLLGVPAASAVEYTFGSAVGSSDFDFTPTAETQKVALCFIDLDGDGKSGRDEPIILATKVATNGVCPTTLSTISILMNAVPGRAAGSEINLADAWAFKTLKTLSGAHFVRYYEDGSDTSKMDAKDTLYLDIKNPGLAIVDIGDVRISANGLLKGGVLVAAGDADLASPLTNIKTTARQIHDANVLYKAGSGFYVNSDVGVIGGSVDGTCATTACPVTGDVGVETGDVRLNLKAANPLSDTALVLPDHVELVQAKVAPGQAFQVKITMKNTGKAAGAGLVETMLDDVVLDGRGTPSIDPNGVAVLTVTLVAPLTPGKHIVKSGTYADFLEVTGTPASDATARLGEVESRLETLETSGDAQVAKQGAPGLTSLLAFGALAAVAIGLRRRQA